MKPGWLKEAIADVEQEIGDTARRVYNAAYEAAPGEHGAKHTAACSAVYVAAMRSLFPAALPQQQAPEEPSRVFCSYCGHLRNSAPCQASHP